MPVPACLLFLALGHAQNPDGKDPPLRRAEQIKNVIALRQQLSVPVKFSGIEDPETSFEDVFNHLQRLYDIRIDVNLRAFRDEDVNVLSCKLGKAMPRFSQITISFILRKVVERIPSVSGAMWFVRGDAVEITTERAYHTEFYPARPNGPFPSLVFADFDRTPLEDALKQLADRADANIVLDVRVSDKAKTLVTARMAFVPVDTAILLLADMADLKPVEIDGVYYVTTRENAKALREEQEKKKEPADPKAAKAECAPLRAETERLLKEHEEQIRRLKAQFDRSQPEAAPKKEP
jgi:hypothetical protein